jgi:hypothetical protein
LRQPALLGEPRPEPVLRGGLAAKKLDNSEQRDELFERSETLADAQRSTIKAFGKMLGREVQSIQRDDGLERLERQQRVMSLSAWTDDDGLWNLRAKFDPLTGVKPSTAPSTPCSRNRLPGRVQPFLSIAGKT